MPLKFSLTQPLIFVTSQEERFGMFIGIQFALQCYFYDRGTDFYKELRMMSIEEVITFSFQKNNLNIKIRFTKSL